MRKKTPLEGHSKPVRGAAMLARIPADLQGAAVFLASDMAAYIHGTILPVDGGWLAW